MNCGFTRSGLSARRKTFTFINLKSFSVLLLAVVSLLVTACNEKTNGQNPKGKETTMAKDSLKEPKVSIQVNKHYDDKGNVIGLDSTYTSYYSNIQGDTTRMDSLMNSFDKFFKRDYALDFNNRFNSLFFKDSIRYPDFFHNDFFMKRYELNDHYFRDMMSRMDSIKNQFYKQHSLKEKDKDSNDL
ncbi:hypothetical protein [Chryseolinea sp. H1M3-3]|uniref:hypothetical protein n=1 Tax=Chryseolinea sp. H1M3-3 TaxID=3034144 RepID=UPI0023EC7D05|nr:hypothetical protein [Chryseolinea sp. H1M3-3]